MLWLLLAASEPSFAVLCIAPLPSAEQLATAGKGASGGDYDDSPEARAERMKQAKKRAPVVFSIGEVTAAPVTDKLAACIDRIPMDERVQLKANGKPFLSFTATEPVSWLTFSAFYSTERIDTLPPRLYCPKRSPTPDCSWCPCKSRQYVPPFKRT